LVAVLESRPNHSGRHAAGDDEASGTGGTMTAGVKSVVRGAIRYLRGPTVSSADLRMLLDALERLSYDARSLQASVGVREGDLEDPDARFPCEMHAAIVARATVARPVTNLALRVVAETPIGANPLIDYLVVTSDTVGEGIRQLARYFRLVGPPVNIEVRDREDPVIVIVDSPFYEFGAEYTIALTLKNFREETAHKFAPQYVHFSHTPDDVAEYERAFRCPVHADSKWAGFAVPRGVWALPMMRRDPILRSVLERHSREIANRKVVQAHDIVREVREVLGGRVLGGPTRMEAIARQLALTPRTLQRRLATAGMSYNEVLDDARREAALEYVSESTLAISEIAYLFGYSERAAFHRAFKRWTGMTPQVFRARQRGKKSHGDPVALTAKHES
jgi:AraC-like DNA-binding protein